MKGLQIEKNRIAVIGFGVSGQSVARYFLENDVEVEVFEDKKENDFDSSLLDTFKNNGRFFIRFASATEPDMTQYDYVIASPGVPMTHRLVASAVENEVEVLTDINAFMRIFRQKYAHGKIISVTGSNGKSTTVSLMKDVMQAADTDVYLGGNIGTSPLDFFDEIKSEEPVVILETSSYQLEYLKEADWFDIACILNLSDNHLNRYGGKKELYAKAKLGGISAAKTCAILNLDDEYSRKYIIPQVQADTVLGIQFEHVQNHGVITLEDSSLLYAEGSQKKVYLSDTSRLRLKGMHNIYNAAFVCGVLHELGIEPSAAIENAFWDFGGLIHRVQFLESVGGIEYVNDSKSTSPDATIKALETIGKTKNIVLISGGNDKDISYDSLNETWNDCVRALVLLPGSANEKLKRLAEQCDVELLGEVSTMKEAVDIASNSASQGDTVLLSPATDSHASFKSFEDRGNQFIQCVLDLRN